MTTHTPPPQLTGLTPILNVSSVPASFAWFEALGWKRCWAWNHAGPIENAADSNAHGPATFAAIGNGEVEIFLCRGAQGARGGKPPSEPGDEDTGAVWMSWWFTNAADVDAIHTLALQRGITITWPPTDEPWGVRECRIVHPDGHTFRISAPLPCD